MKASEFMNARGTRNFNPPLFSDETFKSPNLNPIKNAYPKITQKVKNEYANNLYTEYFSILGKNRSAFLSNTGTNPNMKLDKNNGNIKFNIFTKIIEEIKIEST